MADTGGSRTLFWTNVHDSPEKIAEEWTMVPADTGGSMSSEPQTESRPDPLCSECGIPISEHPDTDACAIEAEARSSHSDVSADLRAAILALQTYGGGPFGDTERLSLGDVVRVLDQFAAPSAGSNRCDRAIEADTGGSMSTEPQTESRPDPRVVLLADVLHKAMPGDYAECYHGLTVSDCAIDAELIVEAIDASPDIALVERPSDDSRWVDLRPDLDLHYDAVEGRRWMAEARSSHSDAGRFYLERDADVSGVSGVGRVAEGYVFEDGTVALRWLTEHRSTAIYASVAECEAIHGHNGSTRLVRSSHSDVSADPSNSKDDPAASAPSDERPSSSLTTGVVPNFPLYGGGLIAAERLRQITEEGYSAEHDRDHANELAQAGAMYALPASERDLTERIGGPDISGRSYLHLAPRQWPDSWPFKPTPNDRVRELVKAGALIAAAIDSLLSGETPT